MSDNEKLTPEYIASIANTIDFEELSEFIKDYGNQQADETANKYFKRYESMSSEEFNQGYNLFELVICTSCGCDRWVPKYEEGEWEDCCSLCNQLNGESL